MIILGINGWLERSHDASACLIIDGKLVAYVEEERLTRQKYSFDRLPLNAIAYCLQAADLSPEEIDLIAWGWELPRLHALHGKNFSYDERDLNNLLFPKKYYPSKCKTIPIVFVDHHLAHAANVYCSRDNDNPMAVVVVDGSGEDASVSIYRGEAGTLQKIEAFPISVSPGFFYEAACQYLGFSRQQAGKLMGLASYGKPDGSFFFTEDGSNLITPFSTPLSHNGILDYEEEAVDYWLEIFRQKWGKANYAQYQFNKLKGGFQPNLIFSAREKNIAATIQQELERVYWHYVQQALKLTGANQVALAGGVALNCSANGMIAEKISEQILVHPASNDAGVALGAAAVVLGKIPEKLFFSPYLGPGFRDEEISKCLRASGVNFSEPGDLNWAIAESLEKGKTVGYFQGRMEIGPRALGARSILADPRKKENNPLVNSIKSRELWRPLAPSVIEADSGSYFTSPAKSPYMLVRNFVKTEQQDSIPAVVHIDGSVRPQTVSNDSHPEYYNLLSKFRHLSNVPIILNTSFNNEKEPIVCTPLDALRTFFEIGLDELAIGSFLIKKRGG